MTLAEIPADPSGLSATVISPTQVDLSWTDNSSNEDGFKVRRGTSATGPFSELSPAPGPDVTTFQDTTASEGTRFWYAVTAYRTITPESGATVAGPVATPPRAPTDLSAVAGGPDLVALTWIDNSSVETAFNVERGSASSGPYAIIGMVPPNTGTGSTSHDDTNGLVDGTRYWYRVTAVKTGFPDSSYSQPGTVVTPIKGPTGLSGTALAGRVNRVSWTDNSGSESAFDVRRALKSGSTCGSYATIGTVPAAAGVGATVTYDDVGTGGNPPLSTKTYCYQVRSRNAESQSAWIGPVMVKTLK